MTTGGRAAGDDAPTGAAGRRTSCRLAVASLLMAHLAIGCRPAATVEAPPAQATAAPAASSATNEYWYGIFLQSRKIGYMQETLRPDPSEPGQWEYTSSDSVNLLLSGQQLSQATVTKIRCDADYRPLAMDFLLSSAGRTSGVTATFAADRVTFERRGGLGESGAAKGVVAVPAGVKLIADARLILSRPGLQPGDKLTFHTFNPVTLGIDENELVCERREPLPLVGETIDTLVVTVKTKFGTMQTWVDQSGRPRQTEVSMMQAKLRYRDMPRDEALASPGEGESVDLATATAIRPDAPIANPRAVRRLQLKVQGLDALRAVPSDAGQRVVQLADGWSRMTITAPPPAAAQAPTAEQLKPYLQATHYIQSDSPELVAAADEADGDGSGTPLDRAHRIQLYVQRRIKWQSNVGMFRSALEVFRDPNGVCRDAAALFTALARANGLPTRVCGGLLYTSGAFMGHAWAETWVGDRWWPVDATLTSEVADAARLKLAQGDDYTALFEMLPALGNLTVRVEEVGGP